MFAAFDTECIEVVAVVREIMAELLYKDLPGHQGTTQALYGSTLAQMLSSLYGTAPSVRFHSQRSSKSAWEITLPNAYFTIGKLLPGMKFQFCPQ